MIANASVRPQIAVLATACLSLLAMTFFCFPVRGEKHETASNSDRNTTASSDKEVAETDAPQNDESSTRTMTIRIVDPAGKPMEGVRVFRNHVYKLEGVERAKIENKDYWTDAEGKAVVTLAGASVDLRLWVMKDSFIPLHAWWAKEFQSDGDQIPQQFTFQLQNGTKIGGIVKNEKGEPIEGVKVEVMDRTAERFHIATIPAKPGNRPVRSQWLASGKDAVFTDAGGRWELANVPPEESLIFDDQAQTSQKLALRLSHPDYAETEWGSLQLEQNIAHKSLRDLTATIVMKRTDDNAKTDTAAPDEAKIANLRRESAQRIKALMAALYEYHEEHNTFPPAKLYGKDNTGGKYPHSWRVALLPYLNEMPLYESYRFDEPWDSPANKEVLARMPAAFRHPMDAVDSANSGYFVLVGNLIEDDTTPEDLQTMFSSKRGVRVTQILDRTDKTAAVFDAKRDIPWTKPQDISYSPDAKLPAFGGWIDGIFQVGQGDGVVRTTSLDPANESAVNEAFVKAWISPAGMEKLE